MIVDRIENAAFYSGLGLKIVKALEILNSVDFADKDDGIYEVEGDNLFYILKRYETAALEQGKVEAHRNYIDVQLVAEGREILGYCPIEGLETQTPYDDDKDVIYYKLTDDISAISLSKGMFCILYPADGHLPGAMLEKSENVLKVVVKIKIR